MQIGIYQRKPLMERLLARVEKQDDGCWLWVGYKNNQGYGHIGRGGRGGNMVRTHRASYELHVGPIPDGMLVCHKCDVPACVNPAHLFLGTSKENMQDCVQKGRLAKGEASGCAKLTETNVIEIRVMRLSGKTQKSIADHFGISYGHVSKIISGMHWSHISVA